MMIKKPYAFISYSSANISFAQILAEQLENAGFHIWIDKKRLDVGHDWWDEIEEGITNCDVFLLIMTPESKDSDWVKREILLAEKLRKPIFPVLRLGDVWSRLADMQYEDMTGDSPKLSQRFIARLRVYLSDAEKKKTQSVPTKSSTSAKSSSTPKNPDTQWTLANKIAFASVVVTAVIGVLTIIVMLLSQNPEPQQTPIPENTVITESLMPEITATPNATPIETEEMSATSTPTNVPLRSTDESTTLILDEFTISGVVDDDLQTMADAQLRYLQTQPFSELETLDWCRTATGRTLTSEAVARGILSGITSVILIVDDETDLSLYITDDLLDNNDGYGLASAPLGIRDYVVLLVAPALDDEDNCITNQ